MITDLKEISVADAQKIKNGHIVEHKVDGTCMNWDGENLVSERGIVRNDRFPHIVQELSQFNWKLQGEIAVPGGHIHHINKKENWIKGRFYAFNILEIDGEDWENATPIEVREKMDNFFDRKNHSFNNLRTVKRFKSFAEGWDFIEKTNKKGYAEGLVMKPEQGGKGFKIKKLHEIKLPIIGHETGLVKGAFLILCENGEVGKVSAASVGFVSEYEQLLKQNLKPYAEIEYMFLTDTGKPFQPRLRRIGTKQTLAS